MCVECVGVLLYVYMNFCVYVCDVCERAGVGRERREKYKEKPVEKERETQRERE